MSNDQEQLLDLLGKCCGYYQAVLDITRSENEMHQEKKPLGEIQSLIKRKKILLSCIEEVEAKLGPLKTFWQEKGTYEDPDSKKIRAQLALLDSTIKEILSIDQENHKMLRNYFKALKSQSGQLSNN